jgi:pimeloyl-ACP methyl ester carboxylesterase
MTNSTAQAHAPIETTTLKAPGATITYDVRRSADTSQPPLMLIGSPMGASGFPTLASHFPDRTVITYDPRGVERSTKDDPSSESTPEQHGDDIHRVIQAVGGPVDLFASSGGAVNALALVAAHPEDVRTLVAHEPALATVLEDAEAVKAASRNVRDTYRQQGFGAGMAKFIMMVSNRGPVSPDFASIPVDPAMFGLPTEDDGSRTDPLLFQNIISSTHYEPDWDALAKVSTRIVIAAGEESEGEIAHRGAEGVGRRFGQHPAHFPDGHGGFLGGEFGQVGKPDEFAARLREVFDAAASGAGIPNGHHGHEERHGRHENERG